MKPKGNIYHFKHSLPRGEVTIWLDKKQKKKYLFLHWLGANMASVSMASLVFFYGTPLFWETKPEVVAQSAQLVETPVEIAEEKPQGNELSITIPSLNASARVVANVDPFNEDEYLPALKLGVAHAKGTALPGEGRRIYLFAHSTNSPLNFTQFNAIFYRLRELKSGDVVTIRVNSRDYTYVVREKVLVSADDVSWIAPTEGEQLVLQTCDPPGTTHKRLLVIAEPV
ncbi:sortase [Candidatus Microgenomates bacterium]|nr:MAG: sortase [Candidatus Microgenomates bacterium]